MRFIALNDVHSWLFLLFLCAHPLTLARAENSCDCPTPPGGRIQCEDQQVAICRVREGKVYGQCKTPPKGSSEGVPLRVWILSELLETQIQPQDLERRQELRQILSEGKYTNPKTREVVTFRLPKNR